MISSLWGALKGIFGSKKFVAGLAGVIVGAVGKFGWDLQTDEIIAILSPLMVAITGQAVADAGKEKAKIANGS